MNYYIILPIISIFFLLIPNKIIHHNTFGMQKYDYILK